MLHDALSKSLNWMGTSLNWFILILNCGSLLLTPRGFLIFKFGSERWEIESNQGGSGSSMGLAFTITKPESDRKPFLLWSV